MLNNILQNWHAYLAAAGLLGLALYQVSQGDFAHATQNFLAALAAFGFMNVMVRHEDALVALKSCKKE